MIDWDRALLTLAIIYGVSIPVGLAVGRLMWWLGSFYLPPTPKAPDGPLARPEARIIDSGRSAESSDAP